MGIKKTVETLVAAVTSTDVATIEGELTKLEQRRAQLAESLDAATHSAIDASAVRRELIISNRDRDALEEASAKVRDAEERRVALDDALRTIGQQISELTARFEEAKDKAERDRVAQALEQEADKVETASLVLDKAAKQFASAYRQLRSAMSPASCLRTLKEPLREDEVARLVAAEALAGAVPGLFAEERGEVAVISVLRRGLSIGDGQCCLNLSGTRRSGSTPRALESMPRFSSRRVYVRRLLPFAPATSLLFFLLHRQNPAAIFPSLPNVMFCF
jgi:Zn-ribbon protein, possibly nucleic acid-binding